MKNAKMIEWLHAYKVYANTYNVKFWIPFVLNYKLKILNLQLEII